MFQLHDIGARENREPNNELWNLTVIYHHKFPEARIYIGS